jgi:hypothetical protein
MEVSGCTCGNPPDVIAVIADVNGDNRQIIKSLQSDKNRENNIKTIYKCQSVGGLFAKQNELCRQCCYQHW